MFLPLPDALPVLEPGWWVVATTADVPADRAITVTRFGRPLVLWRVDGRVRAAWDGCPHRGATLAGARVRDGQLVCPFHSFAFDATGQCTAVPCDGPSASTRGLHLRSLPCRDAHQLVWVWVAPTPPAEALPWFIELDGAPGADFAVEFAAPWDRVVETMLDYAHLPTVHASSIGRSLDMVMQVEMSRTETGMKVWKAPATADSGDFCWEAPASWLLRLGPKVVNAAFFVPIDATRTWVVFRFVQRWVTQPHLAAAIGWVANLFNRRVVREDRAVIEGMARTLAVLPQTDRLVAADAPIAHFRRVRGAWLREAAPASPASPLRE